MNDGIREYRFLPLSPVHIGSGQTLAPEEYLLSGDTLVRFNPHALLGAMNEEGRRRYERLLDDGNLAEALGFLRKFFQDTARQGAGARSRFELYRVRLGSGASREVKRAVEEPHQRKGEIHALPRNPYTGDIIIPGSSIKGAIRTAVVSSLVNSGERMLDHVRAELRATEKRRKAQRLEQVALGYQQGHTEEDPLRLLEVADASWPAAAVRIDRASLQKLGRSAEQTEGMQIHLERLVCQGDNLDLQPDCRVRIELNQRALGHRKVRELVRRPLGWDMLSGACTNFYIGRFNAEMQRFGSILSEGMRRCYPDLKAGDILLRVGHHCHFDSLSVDNLREGWNAARKEPIYDIGSTRTLCELNGGGHAPFGWVLLRPV